MVDLGSPGDLCRYRGGVFMADKTIEILTDKFTLNQSQWLQHHITSIMLLFETAERNYPSINELKGKKSKSAVFLEAVRANTDRGTE